MRKEVVFAILAGALFGLIIAFGLWRLNSTLSPNTDNQAEASPTPNPEFSITIAEPEMSEVVTESPTLITGITKPNSFVVASTDDEDFIAKARSDGGFEIEVDLVGGVNQVLFASIDETGKVATVDLTIAHSTELATDNQSEEIDQEESTNSSDTVREKVQDKVEKAKTVPYFYMGSVTDIAEGAIQIRSDSGEIQQVATTDETTYVTLINDTEEIEFSDIAIGDFLVAMGFRNSNGVLNTRRVLVTSVPGEVTRKVITGKIDSISTGEVLINTEEGLITLDFPRSWKGPDLDELTEGERLIAVGEKDGQTVAIRSIFQTQESSSPEEE